MHTSMGQTYFPGDGPCCSIPPVYSDIVTYNDNGNVWTLQGDLNPGSAYAFANNTGLTISYNTDAGCPRQEDHAGEGPTDCSFYGDLGTTLSSGVVYSIEAYIPYYSFYSTCQLDTGTNQGCTYESVPYDEAAFGIDVSGNLVNVGFAEVCNNPCTSNALEMIAYTSQGGSSCEAPCPLASITQHVYTPLHRLTIVTDRKTFIDIYVDNTLLYSSSTMPIDLNGSAYGLELSERTSINGETFDVTWSNAVVYSSDNISVSGLPSGSSLVVNGTNGFSSTQPADSNGNAEIIVAAAPNNLMVSVELDGKILATYNEPVQAGTTLKLVTS